MKILKENGYALPSILIISLLVITLLLSVLSIFYFINKATSKLYEKKRLELACYSAVQTALTDSSLLFNDSSLVDYNSQKVLLESKQYGFWREVTVSSKGINDSVKVRYLIGIKSDANSYFNNAIVISRPNLRATVVGNTEINGDILGTTDQFIIGNIFGEPSTKKDYLKGNKKIDSEIKSQLIADSLFENVFTSLTDQKKIIRIENSEINAINIKQFQEKFVYEFSKDLQLSGALNNKYKELIKLKANGILKINSETNSKIPMQIYADSLVTIGHNCYLENMQLYSNGPIIIEGGSTLKNVQIFSRDSIHIKNSQFNYPSIICLSVDDTISSNQNKAIILEKSFVNGSILLLTNTSGLSSNRTKINLDSKSKVQGLVYSENNLELIGEVIGTVFTFNFWYYKEPTEYINWLINVKINRKKLDKWFLLPFAFSNQGKYQILKEEWIY